MTSPLVFEQIFYGRGEHGYGILGASPGGRRFASRVESLCGMVGTPAADYGGEPFLISVPDGNHVIMLCGQRGPLDSMGRSTLFFHALVAEKVAMAEVGYDAFELFEAGVFVKKMPSVEGRHLVARSLLGPTALSAAAKPHHKYAKCVVTSCVIRSDKPLHDLVRTIVGDRSLALSWATFAFQPMRGFDVQVLSQSVSCSRIMSECDEKDRLACPGTMVDAPKEIMSQRNDSDERSCSIQGQDANGMSKGRSNAMFGLSVAINVVLAVVCTTLFVSRRSEPIKSALPIVVTNTVERIKVKQVAVSLSDTQRAEIGEAAIKGFCEKLKDGLSDEWWGDFDKAVYDAGWDKYYGEQGSEDRFPKQHAFFAELRKLMTKITQEKITP